MHPTEASRYLLLPAIGAVLTCVAAIPFGITAAEDLADRKATVALVTAPAQAQATMQSEKQPVQAAVLRSLLNDPAIRAFSGVAENTWDFTAPDGVPGFGPLP